MTEWSEVEDEISIFDLGSIILENRFWIVIAAFVGAVLAVTPRALQPLQYTSISTVVSAATGQPGGDSRVMGLANQLGLGGLAGSGGPPTASPAFLIDIATSPVILERVLADSISLAELGGERTMLLDLLVRPPHGPAQSAEARVRKLNGISSLKSSIALTRNMETGVVKLTVTTRWPSVSEAVNQRVLEELNKFYLDMGHSRASEERRFVERRVAEQDQQLEAAESRLGVFLEANRQFHNSPQLTFQHDRLQREVALRQQVLIGLAQALEDVRIREVRDTPLLTVVEPPNLPIRPNPRRRVRAGMVGLIAGGLLGVLASFGQMSIRRRGVEDPRMQRFVALLRASVAGLNPGNYFGSRQKKS